LVLGDGTVLNKGADITATNLTHGKITVNNGDVKFGARKDTKDIETYSKSSGVNLSVRIKSQALDRVQQGFDSFNQMKSGDIFGGIASATNTVTGIVSGLASNQGTKLPLSAVNKNNSNNKNDKNDKNNIPILTGKNAITYFVDKSSIKRVEENEFIYKAQAVVYEVENNNSRRTNSYIHKVLVTYRYDINHSVASVLRTPQYAQDYSLLIYAKQASSGMKLTINSVEDFNYEGFNRFGYSDEENEYFKNKPFIKFSSFIPYSFISLKAQIILSSIKFA